MNLRSSILATAIALAAFVANPATAHDPNEEFDQLPPPAAPPTPTTCAELAKQDARGEVAGDKAKALRLRCAEEKKAEAKAPTRKT